MNKKNTPTVDAAATNFQSTGNLAGVDPLFVDEANRDCHLQSASPGVDNGVPLVGIVDFDFDQGSRPQGSGYDIGAYEYAAPSESTAPGAPSSLAAAATSSSQVDLSWADNATTEDGFKVERSLDNVTFSELAVVLANVTVYRDTALNPVTAYYYRVRAYSGGGGDSSYSNTASATTLGALNPPEPPSDLSATAVSRSRVRLVWTDNAGNESGFKIERSKDGLSFVQIGQVSPDTKAYTATGLSRATRYFFRIRAYNNAGSSAYSNTASATTMSR